jgi:hypothetical protein
MKNQDEGRHSLTEYNTLLWVFANIEQRFIHRIFIKSKKATEKRQPFNYIKTFRSITPKVLFVIEYFVFDIITF